MKHKRKYTKEIIETAAKISCSKSEMLTKLKMKINGGNLRSVNKFLREYQISIAHFTGQGWAKGKTKETDDRIAMVAKKTSFKDEDVFVENSPLLGGVKLIKRLRRLGWKYSCNECSLTEWRQKPITLHLDHINGINNDNRLENLRLLCPNCHQQTDTWGNKKRK